MKRKFYVNPKTNQVVAKSDRTGRLATEIIANFKTSEINAVAGILECMKPVSRFFTGTATCEPNDKFDEYTGKELASAKADYKYHIAYAKRYESLASVLSSAAKKCNAMAGKHYTKAKSIDDDIKKYYIGE